MTPDPDKRLPSPMSKLKEARLLRRLNKRCGLPATASASQLLARVNALVAKRAADGGSGQATGSTPLASVGVGVVSSAHPRLGAQLATGIDLEAIAAALLEHGGNPAIALPEPLDALRRASRTGLT